MDTKKTFYNNDGDTVVYSQIYLLQENIVLIRTGTHGNTVADQRK